MPQSKKSIYSILLRTSKPSLKLEVLPQFYREGAILLEGEAWDPDVTAEACNHSPREAKKEWGAWGQPGQHN